MNMFNIQERIRPHFKMLTPYSSARSEYSGAAQVFLDANENPFENGQNRYPDPLQFKLKTILSSIRNCSADRIFIGNGSDEAIDLLIRLFCEPAKDHILITSPTYGMYKVSATINNVPIVDVPLREDFALPVDKILEQTNENTGIIFICSPNNPTGNAFPTEQILEVVDCSETLVVVDEAYIDFSESESLIHLSNRPNLVVLQTLSKAFGLAGLRLGMAFANPEIIGLLNQIKPPYNISTAAQEQAMAFLNEFDLQKIIAEIKVERESLRSNLEILKTVQKIYPSEANFLLTQFEDPQAVYQYLKNRGIIVRDRSREPGCSGCLRLTVGTSAENKLLMETLQEFESTLK